MKRSNDQSADAASGRRAPTTLGEVTEDSVEQTLPNQQFVYLDIGSVDRESKSFVDLKELDPEVAPSRARQVVRQGDVLVSMTRPNLNAVAMVPGRDDYFVASTGFHVLRSRWVAPKYLYYLVQSDAFIGAMSSLVQGALYPAVRPRDIAGFQFELPPRAEQTRIVETLEELLSDLDAGVAELKAAQRKLAQYRQSLLKAAVEGALTADWRAAHGKPQETGVERTQNEKHRVANAMPPLPETWRWETASTVGEILLGRQRAPQFLTGRHNRKYLRVANIKDDRIDFSDLASMDFDEAHFKKYVLATGDILVSEGQSPELVGQSAIFRGFDEQLCFQKTLHRFRASKGITSPEFAQIVFRSNVSSGVFRALASITTNIAHLTLEKFKASPFPLPPIDEQEKIVSRVDRFLTSMAEAERAIESSLRQAAAQRKNLLKAAFAGDLVPQDPSDEPASDLLARIRAERASNDGVAPRRRRKSA